MRFPEIGEVFAQNYRIKKMLGSGGFSRVYMATQLDLDRAVAIKILQPPIQSTHDEQERDEKLQGLINRFEREARMVSKLKSPHTITMYAYGQDDDGQLFMSIEYVDGRTLSELIREEGALSPDRVAKIMRQVLVSLYEAHDLGMLHRDIKPQNIMVYEHLGQTDQVKLLDFGIVKLIGSESTRDQVDLTSDDTLVGTPRYMAPEYIRGEDLTAASDLYSLGLVMYELLVGERAIQADSSIQIIGKQLERESFYLPTHTHQIDTALRSIINGMLEKNTKLRYDNAALILADLNARDENKYASPPNAPKLKNAPTYQSDHTERLGDAVVERRKAPEDALPVVAVEPLDPSEPDFGIEPLVIANDSGSKKRVLVGLVLLLFLVASVGGLVAMTYEDDSPGGDVTVDSTTSPQLAVTKQPTISAENTTDTLPDPVDDPVDEPTIDDEQEPPAAEEKEPVEPKKVEAALPEPKKVKKPRENRVKKSPTKASEPKKEPVDLTPKPAKKPASTKTDPYKIIIAE